MPLICRLRRMVKSQARRLVPGCQRCRRDSARSEERRVGKECRSLCDWSSDVCSSDLGLLTADAVDMQVAQDGEEPGAQIGAGLPEMQARQREIGRASCRERV